MVQDGNIQEPEDQAVPVIYNTGSITFGLDENDFKDFISKILSKPEVVEGEVEGAYEIGMPEFQNINYQIEQAVSETNNPHLVEFTAELFFDDDSLIRINSINDFLSYEEIRPVVCVGFNFTWIYLIKFRSQDSLQKQEISVRSDYLASPHSIYYAKRPKYSILKSIISTALSFLAKEEEYYVPTIIFSVRSTAHNWGLIVSQRVKLAVETLAIPQSDYTKQLRKAGDFLGGLFTLIFFYPLMVVGFLSLVLGVDAASSIRDFFFLEPIDQTKEAVLAVLGQSFENLTDSQKIDQISLLVRYMVASSSSLAKDINPPSSINFAELFKNAFSAFFIVFSLAFFVGLSYRLLRPIGDEFILFTPRSHMRKKKIIADRKLENFILTAVFLALAISLASSYIFDFLTKVSFGA